MTHYLLLQKVIVQEASSSSKYTGQIHTKSLGFIGDDDSKCYIPMARMINPVHDVILSCEENSELVSYDNGFPARFVVPCHAASCSVK